MIVRQTKFFSLTTTKDLMNEISEAHADCDRQSLPTRSVSIFLKTSQGYFPYIGHQFLYDSEQSEVGLMIIVGILPFEGTPTQNTPLCTRLNVIKDNLDGDIVDPAVERPLLSPMMMPSFFIAGGSDNLQHMPTDENSELVYISLVKRDS